MNTNNEQNQSTISEHLLELRSRIIKSLIFFVLAFIISYINADKIYEDALEEINKIEAEMQSRFELPVDMFTG